MTTNRKTNQAGPGTKILVNDHAGIQNYMRHGSRRRTITIRKVDVAGGRPRYLVNLGGMLVGLRRSEFTIA